MPIYSIINHNQKTYCCKCDMCDKVVYVPENIQAGIYNGAQAARSLHWSFGKDKSVKCDVCRQYQVNDHYSLKK